MSLCVSLQKSPVDHRQIKHLGPLSQDSCHCDDGQGLRLHFSPREAAELVETLPPKNCLLNKEQAAWNWPECISGEEVA